VKILEIGPGEHKRAPDHFGRKYDYIFLDAQGFDGVDVVHGVTGANHLPFDDETFDAVFSSHILEHISYHFEQNVINDWARVLKPGGELHTIVPSWEWVANQIMKAPANRSKALKGMCFAGQINEWDLHYNMFTLDMLEELYRKAKLKVRTSTTRVCTISVRGWASRAKENYVVGVK
jgi:predicted SAM-dependent methyltransferase